MVSEKGLAEAVLEYDEAIRTGNLLQPASEAEHAHWAALYDNMVARARAAWKPLIGTVETSRALDHATAAACLLSESEQRIQFVSSALALLVRGNTPASLHAALNGIVARHVTGGLREALEEITRRATAAPEES